jgi:hypothetical protein
MSRRNTSKSKRKPQEYEQQILSKYFKPLSAQSTSLLESAAASTNQKNQNQNQNQAPNTNSPNNRKLSIEYLKQKLFEVWHIFLEELHFSS